MEESYPEASRVANLFVLLGAGEAMKRDDDLIRELMLKMEDHPDPIYLLSPHLGSPMVDRISYYHLRLLADEGMLEETGKTGGSWRMTMKGHDFVAVIRDESIWGRSKGALAGVGGFTISMLKDVATGYVRQKLAELGIPLS